jgi:uncharacterized protein YjbJ (UPF0337 family)
MKNNENMHIVFKVLCFFIIFIAIVCFLKNIFIFCEGFGIKNITKGASKVVNKAKDKITGAVDKAKDKITGAVDKAKDNVTSAVEKAKAEADNISIIGGNQVKIIISKLNSLIGSATNISTLFKDLKQTPITSLTNQMTNISSIFTSIPAQIENKLKF